MHSQASQLFCFSPGTWQFLPLHQHPQQSTTTAIMKSGYGDHLQIIRWIGLLNNCQPLFIQQMNTAHTYKERTS